MYNVLSDLYGEVKEMSTSEKGIEYGSDKASDKQKALRASGNMDERFQEMADNILNGSEVESNDLHRT